MGASPRAPTHHPELTPTSHHPEPVEGRPPTQSPLTPPLRPPYAPYIPYPILIHNPLPLRGRVRVGASPHTIPTQPPPLFLPQLPNTLPPPNPPLRPPYAPHPPYIPYPILIYNPLPLRGRVRVGASPPIPSQTQPPPLFLPQLPNTLPPPNPPLRSPPPYIPYPIPIYNPLPLRGRVRVGSSPHAPPTIPTPPTHPEPTPNIASS